MMSPKPRASPPRRSNRTDSLSHTGNGGGKQPGATTQRTRDRGGRPVRVPPALMPASSHPRRPYTQVSSFVPEVRPITPIDLPQAARGLPRGRFGSFLDPSPARSHDARTLPTYTPSASRMMQTRIDWGRCPIVTIPPPPRAACPACGSLQHVITRSMPTENDGSRTRKAICERCSSPFLIVVDPDVASDWQGETYHPVD